MHTLKRKHIDISRMSNFHSYDKSLAARAFEELAYSSKNVCKIWDNKIIINTFADI